MLNNLSILLLLLVIIMIVIIITLTLFLFCFVLFVCFFFVVFDTCKGRFDTAYLITIVIIQAIASAGFQYTCSCT